MIISASRRTDIPRCHGEWFLERLRDGFVYVRNPAFPSQVSRIDFSPEWVDCIVFWTKNPKPMLDILKTSKEASAQLERYPFYFQFTLTGYGRDIEPGLPDKKTDLLPVFRHISAKWGKERVVWRYDPIFTSEIYTVDYHVRAFKTIAEALCGCTDQVVVSILDQYGKIRGDMGRLGARPPGQTELPELIKALSEIAAENGMEICSCAEAGLEELGIPRGSCIDLRRIERLLGCKLRHRQATGQREGCLCEDSVDIGAYGTCTGGCVYCYAAGGRRTWAGCESRPVERSPEIGETRRNVHSPMLWDELRPGDRVSRHKADTLKIKQLNLFDE